MSATYIPPVIQPSGTTFAQLQAGGPSANLERFIAANSVAATNPTAAATIVPTGGGQTITNPAAAVVASANGGGRTLAKPSVQATVSVGSATTGSLPAGTYYVGYTFVTASGGETTLGSSASNVFTVTAGLIPTVTLVNLPAGAVALNVYLSNTNGSNTALVLYRKGITQATGATCSLDSSAWSGGVSFANGIAPPTVNTTIGAVPAGAYFAAQTQAHLYGETTIGTSVTASAFTITANSAPSGAPTGAGSGSSGFLPAAATGYLYQVTYVDAWGNETLGTENAAATALTAGQTLTVTFHDTPPDWVVTRNLYLTAANGATGTETLYATGILPTATTYACVSASWLNGTTTQAAARALPTSGTSAAQVPSLTLAGNASGATGQNVYLSAPGGTNTSLVLYATNVQGTTFYMAAAPYNGTTFAAGKVIPATNTTAGGLAAGAYLLNFVETNGNGMTLPSTESASFTVTTGQIPRVTFPALQAGNIARHVFVTAPSGATGTEVLYQLFASGPTATTFDLAVAAPTNSASAVTLPTSNSTTLSTNILQLLRYPKTEQTQRIWDHFHQVVTGFNQGNPSSLATILKKNQDVHEVILTYAALVNEIGNLIVNNPGTIRNIVTPALTGSTQRTWP